MNWRLLVGDVREQLATLPDASVQTCVTSPPYWGLRDYGTASWEGGSADCDHATPLDGGPSGNKGNVQQHPGRYAGPECHKCGAKRVDRQLGLEATPEEFCASMVEVFRGVRRVLKADGTCWVNLGDTYLAQQGMGFNGNKRLDLANRSIKVKRPAGVKPKDLVGIPWMVAFALRADGWYLRSDIIWAKPNPMPESVTDRPTKAHEYLFLLSQSERYYYDSEAVAEPAADLSRVGKDIGRWGNAQKPSRASAMGRAESGNEASGAHWVMGETRNIRSVWSIATQPYPDAHFATFPEALPERCIKAGSRVGDTVLDPFTGSGTTGAVALRLGREFVGIELNPQYAQLARARIGNAAPLFTSEQSA